MTSTPPAATDAGADDRTLLDALARHLRDRPGRIACQDERQALSFEAVEARSNQLAHALRAAGVRRDDRVACLTKHHTECLLLTLAALKLGAVCMPVNWRLAAREIEYVVHHGEAVVLMADAAFVPIVEDCRLPLVRQRVGTDASAPGWPSFEDFIAVHADRLAPVEAAPDDAALQLYSSGTTGLPKGVVLSHRGLLSTDRTVASLWGFGGDDVLGNPLPTFHVAGMTMLLLTLYTGGRTVSFPDFDPAAFMAAIGRERITQSFLVPAMLLFMLQSPTAKEGDYRSLRLVAYGGSPISERVLHESMRTFGCDFLQVYGLTEVSGPCSFLMPADHRGDPGLLRSAGRAVGGARVRIVDPVSLQDLPEGTTGEVWIESERNLLEYWRNPEATAAAFPEGRNAAGGWFRSGDGGYLENGYLFIHDRIKDMIISGGENIYPAEIENVLMTHPAVADGAIIGVPDDTWGEAIKACVVLKPGAVATPREIIDWMRERLAHFKCPKSVDFVEALPRNPSGKLLKRVLREPYWQGRERGVN